ncbi:MAG TPA: TolC family protein, partial [Pyrinomonadaceae bacterium]|nr:TolC family protein [Pyrinomonadaceae bacterium]
MTKIIKKSSRGIASKRKSIRTERRSLSAKCGVKAALLAVLFLCCSLTAIAQTPSPTPALPSEQLQVPAIAPDFHPTQKPLPELGRVGVDMDRQKPLSLREALALALENNKDIEVARHNVKIAEFDLTAARGSYDPRLTSSTYYERLVNPISSFLSGGSNGATTQTD